MNKRSLVVLTSTFLLTSLTHAANINVSSSKISSAWNKFKEKSSMGFFSVYTGPGITRLNEPGKTVNSDGQQPEDSSANNWNQLSYRYQLTDDTRLIFNPRFSTNYSGDAINATRNEEAEGDRVQAFRLLNPVAGFTTTWFRKGNLSFTGGLNTILFPVEEGTFNDEIIANPGGFNTLAYSTPTETYGMWIWGRFTIQDPNKADTTAEARDYVFWLSPFYEYKFTDKTLMRAWIDVEYEQGNNAGTNYEFTHFRKTAFNRIGVGVDTMLTSNIGIYPYILTQRSDRNSVLEQGWSTNNAVIGAWIYGTIF